MVQRRRSRMVDGGVASFLLAASLAVVPLATPAAASCSGVGSPTVKVFSSGGYVVTEDRPNSGTCDGDTYYGFVLNDGPHQDGRCSYIDFGQSPSVTRYTCGSVGTNYDDTDTFYSSRFRLSGANPPASSWFGSSGH